MPNLILPPAVPTLTIAGRVFTDLQNLIVIRGHFNGVGAAYTGFAKTTGIVAPGTGGYVVPASKTFQVHAMSLLILTAAAGTYSPAIGYGDTDIAGSAAAAPANAKYSSNASASGSNLSPTPAGKLEVDFRFDIPTGKYAFAYMNNQALVGPIFLYGYEV